VNSKTKRFFILSLLSVGSVNQFNCILNSLRPFLITLESEKTEEVLSIADSPNIIKPTVFVCLSIRSFVLNDVQLYACLAANFC